MAVPARQTWSELSRWQKVCVIAFTVVASIALSGGLIFLLENRGWASETPETEAQQLEEVKRAEAKNVAKNIEDLEKDVGKKLRPNKNIQVKAGQRPDGLYFVLAEYKPLLKRASPIEDDMLEAYKAIYTSGLPVVRAEIVAIADLVDSYGNKHEDPIYRSSMDGDRAKLINWENLSNVSPSAAFNDSWRHPLVR